MSAASGRTRTEQPAGIKPLSLVTRAVTAAAYGAVVLGVLWWGALPTGVAFGVMAAFAAAEFYAMQRREARLPNEVFGVRRRRPDAGRCRAVGSGRAARGRDRAA